MKVKILKTDKHTGVVEGEIYTAKYYDFEKVTLLSRVPDGYDPCCNEYLHNVSVIE